MRGEKGLRAWCHSGQKARYIDRYTKEDKLLTEKAKEKLRKNLNVDKAVEELLKIMEEAEVHKGMYSNGRET